MSTPLADALSESSAVRSTFSEWPRVGLSILIRKWQLTEDAHREAALSYLNTIEDVTDPKADGKTYSGSWRAVKAYAGALKDKEGMHVYQVLVKGTFSEADFIVTENNCSYQVKSWYLWMVASLPVLPANYEAHTFSWGGVSYDRETGTYSAVQQERIRLYQDTTALRSGGDYFADETTRKQEGVTSSTTQPPSPAFVTGHLISQSISLESDCTKTATTQDRAAIERLNAVKSRVITLFETTDDVQHRNTSDTALPSAQTPGAIVTVRDAKNETGLTDVSVSTRTAAEVLNAQLVDQATAFESTSREERVNQSSADSAASQVAGYIKVYTRKKNEFARYDNGVETRTAIPKTDARIQSTATLFESRVVRTNRHAASATATTSPSQTAGTIETDDSAFNDFKLWDNDTTQRVANEVEDVRLVDEETAFESVSEEARVNQSSADTPASQTAGTIISYSREKNEFARVDNRTRTRTAIPSIESPAVVIEKNYDGTRSRISAMHQASLPDISSHTLGSHTVLVGDQNEFQLFNYVKTTDTVVETLLPAGTTDFSYADRLGTFYFKYLFNILPANIEAYVQAFANRHSGYSIGGTPSFDNRTGTYSVLMTASPVPTSSTYGDAFTTGTAEYSYTNKNGEDITVYVKFTTSLSAAETFLNASGGGTTIGADSGNRTGLTYVGRGRIAATRVELN